MADSSSMPAAAGGAADLAGRRLGDYRLLRRLGRGGMSEVYLAEQCSLRRTVALKILKAELAGDPTCLKRFQIGAEAAAALVHANIVQIYEVGVAEGVHFLAQEYVPGENLREHLSRNGPPGLGRAVSIMRQVAAALCRAGERGVVHRDIKPENILLAASGEAKVADFGLARIPREAGTLALTQAGMTMGTPLYMSPEQIQDLPLDPRSDIYSFGVTCYHLLAGHPPFVGETALAVAVQHLHAQPVRLENLRPDLPPALCRIVHQMMAKDRNARYQSARELLDDLRALPVPGGDESGAAPVGENFSSAGPAAGPGSPAATGPLVATQRLAALMRAPATQPAGAGRLATLGQLPTLRRLPPLVKLAVLAVGLAAAFALGAWLAWQARDPWLLADADPRVTRFEKRPTAAAQFMLAQLAGTETAYQSVIEYYPRDEYYVHLAERELAWLYLFDSDYQRAWAMFEKLADLPEDGPLRAFGLAGQCVVLSLQGQHKESSEKLELLLPLREQLDQRMRQLVASAARENRQRLGYNAPEELSAWLQERFGELAEEAEEGE